MVSESMRSGKPGLIEPSVVKKGFNECDGVKEGEVFWTIKLEDGSYYDTPSQDVAETISRLVTVERKLDKLLE